MNRVSQFLTSLFKSKAQRDYEKFQKEQSELRRESLNSKNLHTAEDLEKILNSLIKRAVKVTVESPRTPEPGSAKQSHFGGVPYFNPGEEWPCRSNGNPLSFVCQFYNTGSIGLPERIKLVQFYYDWKDFSFQTEDDGWLVKMYETIDFESMISIERPSSLEEPNYCPVSFEDSPTLPDWEGIRDFYPEAADLSAVLNEEEPWENFSSLSQKLAGEEKYQTQIGGYPHWVQGSEHFRGSDGNPLPLLMQIDSETNADIMWGDTGLVYFFYDESINKVYFTFQCF